MQANTKLSVANFEEALRVPKALGLDPAAADLLATASSTAHQLFPGRLSQGRKLSNLTAAALGKDCASTTVKLARASSSYFWLGYGSCVHDLKMLP